MKQKILLIGDYLNGTGFHRVVAHIKNAIKNDFEVHHVGLGYHGDIITTKDGVIVHPETDENGGHLGYKYIARLIDEIDPDIFFIVYDMVFIRFLLQALRNKSKHMVRGAYVALDGEITKRRKMISTLKDLDFCVWYTDFAYNHVHDLLKEQPSLLSRPIDFRIIPHGVESSRFYPISEDQNEKKILARRKVFPNLKDAENTFIVLNANRPAPRKRIDLTLKAFAEFVKDKSSDEVKLYLHHSFAHGNFDRFTHQIIQEYNLKDYLLTCPLATEKSILTNEQLNYVYNACDVGINTCMGEGWGLTNFEHAATKAPQILPAHSCFPEIWKNTALWVTSMEKKRVGFTPHNMFAVDAQDAANQLEKFYKNRALLDEYAQNAYENVIQEKYQWKYIETQWHHLFQQYANVPKLALKKIISTTTLVP